MHKSTVAWTYVLAPDTVLLSRQYRQSHARWLKEKSLSRKEATDWLNNRLIALEKSKIPVYQANGVPFLVSRDLIDRAYGADCLEYRWHTDVLKFADYLPKRAPNKKLLLRYQLWDLAAKADGDPIKL